MYFRQYSTTKKIIFAIVSTIMGLGLYTLLLALYPGPGKIESLAAWLLVFYFIPFLVAILIAGQFVQGLNLENQHPPFRIAGWAYLFIGVLALITLLLTLLLEDGLLNDFVSFLALLTTWCVALLVYCFALSRYDPYQ